MTTSRTPAPALHRPRRARILAGLTALAALLATPVLVGTTPAHADPSTTGRAHAGHGDPLVIAHRGASGYRPEHTLAAYELAIEMGADHIEPDLVPTKDGVLVARHENEIGGTTDVADRPEFADRRTTKTIDGRSVTGWFTEDFTLAELKTLRAVERLPGVRPDSAAYDGRFQVPTFEEVLDLVQRVEAETGRVVGLAPETKHPTYFDRLGLSPEEPLVATLHAHGLRTKKDPVVLQSFEVTNLRELDRMTRLPIAQLLGSGAPYDQVAAGTGLTYADMRTRAGLRAVSKYADWLAPEKSQVLPRTAHGTVGEPSGLVADAHRAGLLVVVYTLRAENQFMPADYRSDGGPNEFGDLAAEITDLLDLGVDAVFSDHPDLAVAARDDWLD
ncbi:glycerophosphodiester phosphodiesterase [Nocardioides panacisoli]|uniref:glycerophosphodiester phosphodiesterase n=1 Tax=Nocardioides panacisoli TaxID=627624 RepID=UPI001C635B4D|nr:glycerophosphodiester phosphodiesterase [Nocardioides panacisoli]QYJ04255.1 glycerophosphodiester phosphodiesterase [Nocardioides panacisoli]